MAVKNPKNKGNEFERKVVKMLSDWAGVKFMRTPSSGAIHNFKDKRGVSDIVAPLSIGNFPFSIECKNVECSWELSALLEGTSQTINKHWQQCSDDAAREELIPLLVFTKNFREVYAIMDFAVWLTFPSEWVVSIPSLVLTKIWEYPLIVFKLQTFLEKVSINNLMSMYSLQSVVQSNDNME